MIEQKINDIVYKMTEELVDSYFGSKLIEENQEIDFSWRLFPKKCAHFISHIVCLKTMNLHEIEDQKTLKEIINFSYSIAFNYTNKKMADFLKSCQIDYLPISSYNVHQARISLYYSYTTLITLKFILEDHVDNMKPLSEKEIGSIFNYLCYKGTTAALHICNNEDIYDKIILNKEEAKRCEQEAHFYIDYILNSNNKYIETLKKHNYISRSDINKKLNNYLKTIRNEEAL